MRRATWLAVFAFAAAAEGGGDSLGKLPPLDPGAVRLYVVRHGEALSNLARPPAGSGADLDRLTDRGHAQSRAAGAALAGEAVEEIVTSPAHRARETTAEIAPSFPAIVVRVADTLGPLRNPRPDQGARDLGARVSAVIKDIGETARAHGAHGVVIVTHGEVVEALLGAIKGPLALHGTMAGVRNASITVVDVDADGHLHVVAEDRVPWH